MKTNKELLSAQEIVKRGLVRLRKKNPNFSNNSLARSIGVSSSFISQFLNHKKDLSEKTASAISKVLDLSQKESNYLILKTKKSKETKLLIKKAKVLRADYKEILSMQSRYLDHWYNLAIAELTQTKNYQHCPHWIAKRIGISVEEAEYSLKLLEELEIIYCTKGKWQKKIRHINMPTKCSLFQIRGFHKMMMDKATEHMETNISQKDFDKRSIRGRVLSVDSRKVTEVKEKIINFFDELTVLSSIENADEVYHLGIQFFPLTKNNKE